MAHTTKRQRSPMEIAADRLSRLALSPSTVSMHMARVTQDTLDTWAAEPSRADMAADLRGVLASALAEAREQAADVDELDRAAAERVVANLEAAVAVLDG